MHVPPVTLNLKCYNLPSTEISFVDLMRLDFITSLAYVIFHMHVRCIRRTLNCIFLLHLTLITTTCRQREYGYKMLTCGTG